MDQAQIEANITLEQALRRSNLLVAAAEVSQNITQIMDMDRLLPKTVDIICEAYDFYYSGVFLIDEAGEFAVLRAGRGEPGRIMIENNHKLAVGGNSMIGACTALNEARISLDVDTERVWYPNPVLPDTRSEMALPLAIGSRVIGAVTVQSVEAAAFSDEDISSLQAMANQLAIAIENARQRRELDEAHAELVRAKTYEAIATATGDAIHWIGNKAEPIGESAERVRQDLQLLICIVAQILPQGQPATAHDESLREADPLSQPVMELIQKEASAIQRSDPVIVAEAEQIMALPLSRLEKRLSLNSMLDDLDIIEDAARLIMKVKEELIGPAREQAPRPTMLDDVLKDTINNLAISPGVITENHEENLPLVLADPLQLSRVFANLLTNAIEAMVQQPQPQISLDLRCSPSKEFVQVTIADNGTGIAEPDLDKIWITFHTTKGMKGHPGLGLPACRLILQQIGGNISVASTPGQGAIFTVNIPVDTSTAAKSKGPAGKGRILIIDDDDRWRHFAVTTLETAGYKVACADEDIRVDNYAPCDLIVIDDNLAYRDSLTLLREIKKGGAISKTVAVSSNPRVERTKERILLGIQNFLPKPYIRVSLLNEIRTALRAVR
jgi:signal transduction histidine kinase